MERRNRLAYVPASEALEQRQVLSTAAASLAQVSAEVESAARAQADRLGQTLQQQASSVGQAAQSEAQRLAQSAQSEAGQVRLAVQRPVGSAQPAAQTQASTTAQAAQAQAAQIQQAAQARVAQIQQAAQAQSPTAADPAGRVQPSGTPAATATGAATPAAVAPAPVTTSDPAPAQPTATATGEPVATASTHSATSGGAAINTPGQNAAVSNANQQGVSLANTAQKTQRIQRLPYWIESLSPGRPLPMPAIQQMQYWLTQVMGQLGAVPSGTLNAFNTQMRQLVSQTSATATDIEVTQAYFQKCLQQAGATPAAQAGLGSAMLELAKSDTRYSSRPAELVANDYALILQTTLAVGRPLAPPNPPRIVPVDNTGNKNDFITSNPQPRLTGTYQPNMTVRILALDGSVLGAAPTNSRGQYTVSFNQPLALGNTTLRMQGQDDFGVLSLVGRPFTIRVVSR